MATKCRSAIRPSTGKMIGLGFNSWPSPIIFGRECTDGDTNTKHCLLSLARRAPLSKQEFVGSNATGGYCVFVLGRCIRAGLRWCICFSSQPRRRQMLIAKAFDIAEHGFCILCSLLLYMY